MIHGEFDSFGNYWLQSPIDYTELTDQDFVDLLPAGHALVFVRMLNDSIVVSGNDLKQLELGFQQRGLLLADYALAPGIFKATGLSLQDQKFVSKSDINLTMPAKVIAAD